MSNCDKCGSDRIADIFAHSKDLSSFVCPADGIYSEDTYFPDIPGICCGDDLSIVLCLACGKVQGTFPIEIEVEEGCLSIGKLRAKIEEQFNGHENEYTDSELELLDELHYFITHNLHRQQYIEEYEVAWTFDEEQLKLINQLLGEEYE